MTENPAILRRWGFWAVMAGAAALILVFAQMVGPSFEAKASVGTQIGEIAGEIKRSAWRSFFGLQSEPAAAGPVSLWVYVSFAAPILGIVAIVLSLVSAVSRENRRFVAYGTAMGVAAIVFHFFWWVAILVAGAVLLVAIIENIGDIFSLS